MNRELAIQLAKFPEVKITFLLPKWSQEDRKIALEHRVKIVPATPLPAFEQLDCMALLSAERFANRRFRKSWS